MKRRMGTAAMLAAILLLAGQLSRARAVRLWDLMKARQENLTASQESFFKIYLVSFSYEYICNCDFLSLFF